MVHERRPAVSKALGFAVRSAAKKSDARRPAAPKALGLAVRSAGGDCVSRLLGPAVWLRASRWCRWSLGGLVLRDWAVWPVLPMGLAALVLCLGAVGLVDRWVWRPAWAQQAAQWRLVAQQADLVEGQVRRLAHSQSVQKRLRQWQQDPAWRALFLPDGQAMPLWLQALGESAQRHGVRLESVRPVALVLQDGLADWPVLVQAKGGFVGLRAWVLAVQAGPLLVKLEHFKLSPDARDPLGLVLDLRLAAQRPLAPSEWPSGRAAKPGVAAAGGQSEQAKSRAQSGANPPAREPRPPRWREAPRLPGSVVPRQAVYAQGRGPFAEPAGLWAPPAPALAPPAMAAGPPVAVDKPSVDPSAASAWTSAPLAQMRLVGGIRDPLQGASLLRLGKAWRLVRVGEALGPHQGKVLEAGPQRLRVRQRLPQVGGGWRDHEQVLLLARPEDRP